MTRMPPLAASTPGTPGEDTRLHTIRAAILSALDAFLERQAERRKELQELKQHLQAEKRRFKERTRLVRKSTQVVQRKSIRHAKMEVSELSRACCDRTSLEEVRRALREGREREKRAFVNRVVQGVRDVYAGKAAPFYRAAGLSRSAYSKIISHPDHRPSKETALAMAAALGMNPGDAKAFLHLVGYSLSEYVREDVIWATCFEHGVHGLADIKSLLAEFGNAAPSGPTGRP